MAMQYVIDGYNLLHAMGVLAGRIGPHGLKHARQRLLGWLQGAFGTRQSDVTVVFDGGGPEDAERVPDASTIQVRYAGRRQEADDLIEQLIQECSAAKQLSVVSSDRRLRQAATRRGAHSITSEAFMDELERIRRERTKRSTAVDDKPMPLQGSDFWLREFADLDQDPLAQQLFSLDDFARDMEAENEEKI